MLNAVIDFSLKNRFVVLLLGGLLIAIGARAALRLPLDAFPDTTPTQVQINASAPELAPEEVERLVTAPLEFSLGGLKGLEELRSVSKFGFSQVVALFADGTDVYFARQQVAERLSEVDLPEGISRPTMGPVATGLGEIYHYILSSENPEINLADLRALQDWVIRPRLLRVPGVAEVNAWGGFEKQFEVQADPSRLNARGITLDQLTNALRENNRNVGAGYVARGGEASLILGVARVATVEQIASIVIETHDGVPIRVRDVAGVQIGHAIRRGSVTANGQGEAVLGLAFMRMGENSRAVSHALDAAMNDARKTLPRGVKVNVVYRRTDLVNSVLKTVERNLIEGAALVIAILFAFLGSVRAGLIVASVIPLSMLFGVTMMEKVGIAGSLMSLGAIDFGLVVDSSVVMVENCARRLAHDASRRSKIQIIRDAAVEVRKPTMFGELIIMIVYLPILTLEGIEGKLFRPMALTVIFALCASLVLSLTLMPVLASLGLPRRVSEKPTIVDRFTHWLFQPMLRLALHFPRLTLTLVGAATIAAAILGRQLGSEFVPRLNEGSVVINTIRLASVSLEESTEYGTKVESYLKKQFPTEIAEIWSRTGTAEVATDPMGVELTDVFISLTPRSQWSHKGTQQELVAKMAKATKVLPGMRAAYTQPIEMRINEMVAGIRSDLGIKLYGPDLDKLKEKAGEIEVVIKSIPGAADTTVEQVTGQPVLKVNLDAEALSRHGVAPAAVLDVIQSIGGTQVGEILERDKRFPLVVRLPAVYRDDPDALRQILIPVSSDQMLPITQLVSFEETTGPSTIQRDWGERRIVIQTNVRGRDIASFVKEAQSRIAGEVRLDPGYTIAWGGQFEHLQRAERRLYFVVPLALILILSLLYLSFRSVRDALMIFAGVLFARTGGVIGLYVMGLPFTISAGVGFVVLAGASILEGLVLVASIRDHIAMGLPKREAIEQARLVRLRPVLMTGAVAALGFVPMMLSTGIGAEVQKPLATVVVFGMVCDTFLTMLALPALYLLFGKGPVAEEETCEADAAGGSVMGAHV